MGKSKHLKMLRKEIRKGVAAALPGVMDENRINVEAVLKPKPRWMPFFAWKMIGKIYFKVPLQRPANKKRTLALK